MKWFVSLIAFGGLVAIVSAASCGPQKPFCPSTPDFSCFDQDGNVIGGAGGQNVGICDGQSQIICSDSVTKVCKVEDCPKP